MVCVALYSVALAFEDSSHWSLLSLIVLSLERLDREGQWCVPLWSIVQSGRLEAAAALQQQRWHTSDRSTALLSKTAFWLLSFVLSVSGSPVAHMIHLSIFHEGLELQTSGVLGKSWRFLNYKANTFLSKDSLVSKDPFNSSVCLWWVWMIGFTNQKD